MFSFTSRPLNPRRKSSRYPLDRRLGELQNRSGRRGEEKNLALTGTPNSDPSVVQQAASRYTDCAIPAPLRSSNHVYFLIWRSKTFLTLNPANATVLLITSRQAPYDHAINTRKITLNKLTNSIPCFLHISLYRRIRISFRKQSRYSLRMRWIY
jgi:hypothetical protein